MVVSRHVRTWHRRLSLVVGVQLLLWTGSGLLFTWDPIEVVRGETVLAAPAAAPPVDVGTLVPLGLALAAAGPLAGVDGARLARRRERWTWVLPPTAGGAPLLVDATSGTLLPELTGDEAAALADEAFTIDAHVSAVERIDVARGEYRGKPVPAWRVAFDDELHTNLYVDAHEGVVTSVRSDLWRRFDLFWMLHIMDYSERTDFHTPWLTLLAGLGVASSLSGLWLAALVLLGGRRESPAATER